MALPESSRFQLTPDTSICRVLNGMWQVSGAHGPIEFNAAIDSMLAHHDKGERQIVDWLVGGAMYCSVLL